MSDEEYSELFHVRAVLKQLPGNIKAFSVPHLDGYAIVVNDALGPVEQLEALEHEVRHIRNGDHFKPEYQEYTQ